MPTRAELFNRLKTGAQTGFKDGVSAVQAELQKRGFMRPPAPATAPGVPSAAAQAAQAQAAQNAGNLGAQLRGAPPGAGAPIPPSAPPPGAVPPAAGAGPAVPPRGVPPAAAKVGFLRRAGTGALAGGALYGAGKSVYESLNPEAGDTQSQLESGLSRLGVEPGMLNTMGAAALRTFSNIGNAVTGGLAGQFGENFANPGVQLTADAQRRIAGGELNPQPAAGAAGAPGAQAPAYVPENKVLDDLVYGSGGSVAGGTASYGDGRQITPGRGSVTVVPRGSLPVAGAAYSATNPRANGALADSDYRYVTGLNGNTTLRRMPAASINERVRGASEPGQQLGFGGTVYDANFTKAKAEGEGRKLMQSLRRTLDSGLSPGRKARLLTDIMETQSAEGIANAKLAQETAQGTRQLDLTERGQDLDFDAAMQKLLTGDVSDQIALQRLGLDKQRFAADQALDAGNATRQNQQLAVTLLANNPEYQQALKDGKVDVAQRLYDGVAQALAAQQGTPTLGTVNDAANLSNADAAINEAYGKSLRLGGGGALGDVLDFFSPESAGGNAVLGGIIGGGAGAAAGRNPGAAVGGAALGAGAAGAITAETGQGPFDFNYDPRKAQRPTGDIGLTAVQLNELATRGTVNGQRISQRQLSRMDTRTRQLIERTKRSRRSED